MTKVYTDIVTGKKSVQIEKLPPIELGYDSYFIETEKPSQFIDKSVTGISRYLSALPIDSIPITLGEGSTPLIASKMLENVHIKNEGMNPTGNFKDRESAFALAFAYENGYKTLAIASSGNAALSAALYSRLYNIRLTCYIPERTPASKRNMINLFGAQTHVVGQTYEETYHYLLDNLPRGSMNITSGVMPSRTDGSKTIAYEIWEELGRVPEVIVCPAGNGSLLSAIYHGFADMKNWGYTDKIPKIVSVQIRGADPINQAFDQKKWLVKIENPTESDCEAIVAEESFCSPKAVYAMRKSGGFGVSVTDHQVLDGLRFSIDNEGIFPEFSSASVFAAMLDYEDQIRKKGQTVVLINTATGLKETQFLQDKLNGH